MSLSPVLHLADICRLWGCSCLVTRFLSFTDLVPSISWRRWTEKLWEWLPDPLFPSSFSLVVWKKNNLSGTVEMAKLVKSLLCKHEDPGSLLSICRQWPCAFDPSTGKAEAGRSLGLLAIPSSWIRKLLVLWEILTQKVWWRMIEEDTNINFCFHMQVYTRACSPTSTCGSCFQVTLLFFGYTFLIILCKHHTPL